MAYFAYTTWMQLVSWKADELGDMSLLDDGGSTDPACKREFVEALRAILDAEAESGRYTRPDQQLT
ncbi:hypothetical protein U2F10_08300 [Leptothoe sp. EHU-05/26/07-4]